MSSIFKKTAIVGVLCSLIACGGGSSRGGSDRESNNAPILSAPEPISVLEDQTISVRIAASDEDGDELRFSSSNLPAWLSLNASTGELAGTPTRDDVGFESIAVSVSDQFDTDSATLDIEVVQVENLVITGKISGIDLREARLTFTIFDSDVNINVIQEGVVNTDESGRFRFNLTVPTNEFTGDELLEINAAGIDEQKRIELVSQVGSLDYLITSANENGVVSEEELLRLNLSPITTALAIQTRELNGRRTTVDWDLIQGIEQSIQINNLLALATDIGALANLSGIETPFGQSLIEVFESSNNAPQDTLDQLFVLNNLFNFDGEIVENFLQLKESVRAELVSNDVLTNDFVINNITSLPIVIGREFVLGTRPSTFSQNLILNSDGSGQLNQFTDTSIDTTNLNWEVIDNTIVIPIEDGVISDVDIFQLADRFGFDFSVQDFLTDNFFDGTLEERFIELRFSNQQIVITGLSQTETGLSAIINHTLTVNLDDILSELNFEEEFPSSIITGQLGGNRQLITDTSLQFSQEDFVGESWALPILSEFGVPLGGGTIDRSVHDLFGFNGDGTSSTGLLSGEIFTWQIEDGKLEILTRDEEFVITPLIETDEEVFILVDRINNSGSRVVTTDNMTKLEPENIELFGQNFILPTVTPESGLIWQTGANVRTNPNDFNSLGQLTIENVFGWGFLPNSENQASWIQGSFMGDDCLRFRTEECFSDFSGLRDIEIDDSLISLSFQQRDDFFRQRFWNVLSYDPVIQRARILEYTVIELDGVEGNISIEPRINVFQLVDLAEYSREYEDSQSLFEVQISEN